MCTLTIIQNSDQIIVTMNRDESRTREELGVLENNQSIHGVRAVFPIDLQSSGSWFGVNNSGIVLAILNRYQDPLKKNVNSRGKIIPKALSLGGVEEVFDFCETLQVNNYNPFDLILISRENFYRFSWNGMDYHITPIAQGEGYFITSSSVDMVEVLSKREKQFLQWSTQNNAKRLAKGILNQFHLSQQQNKSHSVLMSRQQSHTKSICQAVVTKTSSHLHYLTISELKKFLANSNSKLIKQTVILPFKTHSKEHIV